MAKVNVDLGAKVVDGLVAIEPVNVPSLFNDETNMRIIIDMVKVEVAKHPLDLTTAKGRKERKSLAHTVSKSKVLLDDLGKDLTVDLKAKVSLVDGIRKIARDELDTLRDEVKEPVLEWERKDEERIAKIQEILSNFSAVPTWEFNDSNHATQIRAVIAETEIGDDMDEFKEKAEQLQTAALESLDSTITNMIKAEADQAELEQLRADKEKRESEESEEKRIAEAKVFTEAAEAARIKREAEIRKEEQDKADREKQEAIEQAEQDKEAAIQAERDRVEREKAAQDETDRKQIASDAKKAANKRHQAKIHNAIIPGLVDAISENFAGEISCDSMDQIAKDIIKAMAKGQIANVSISY